MKQLIKVRGQSLEGRFNTQIEGGSLAVLKMCWEMGYGKVMSELGVNDEIAMRKFLKRHNAENCPRVVYQPVPDKPYPQIDSGFMQAKAESLLGKLLVENERLKAELEQKEWQLNEYRKQNDLKVDSDFLRVCEIKL